MKIMPSLKLTWCLLFTFIVLGLLTACENGGEPTKTSTAKYHDFKLANSSDHKVYGFFEFGESKGDVGVIGAGKGKTMGFMPFSHSQKAIVTFKCGFEDELPCATGEVDVSEHYPTGEFKSITTVFTYKPDNTVELSFSISELSSEPGTKKNIAIGNISKQF